MSALSTPGGGGTTAQSKPTSGKQKYQKLDINSLYCANKNENSEPSSVKSQLSRKHGMQSLGKVPSARRPPANLPSLKTETGQDSNANSISASTTAASTPAVCNSQAKTISTSSNVVAGGAPGGWVPLPPPSSPHFRTEFPSLEAAQQHRGEHPQSQPSLRPQTEGSWTCGGTAGVRQEQAASPAAAPVSSAAQQAPTFRTILPSFLMKGSGSSGIGLGTLGSLGREPRPAPGGGGGGGGGRQGRPPPRAPEVLTPRPILREEQISSLDDLSRDAGWAQHDDIDYDQKLDFSDGESSAPKGGNKGNKSNNNRGSADNDKLETKIQDAGDEEQIWAERRQKQSNEVAAAVARARQRKEEEQRKQQRDAAKEREHDARPDRERAERSDRSDRSHSRERDRDRDRPNPRDRDVRDKERPDNRDRDRYERDRSDRIDNRDRDRGENKDRRMDHRDRSDDDKDRERNDNRDRERFDRERGDRDRSDRDKMDRDRDRDRDFRDRDRDRDYGRGERERDSSNAAFSKTFQANIPPRFLKKQQGQGRQQEEPHKGGWAFPAKPPPRRPEPPQYAAPRHAPHAPHAAHAPHAPHNGRRSYSRDYSDREDEFRRDKEGSGQQWRSEMQDYDRSGRDLDRQNSKDSYKEYDHKDRRNDSDRRSMENEQHNSRTSAADKLSEVFERKSIGLIEPFASSESSSLMQSSTERRLTPPSNSSQRESSERDFSHTSWAEASQDDQHYTVLKPHDKHAAPDGHDAAPKDAPRAAAEDSNQGSQPPAPAPAPAPPAAPATAPAPAPAAQQPYNKPHQPPAHNQSSQHIPGGLQSQQQPNIGHSQTAYSDSQPLSKKPLNQFDSVPQILKQPSLEQVAQQNSGKPFASQRSEKDFSESESVASKSSTDPASGVKINETLSAESLHAGDPQKRSSVSLEDKRPDRFSNDQLNKIPPKDPIERKSSGSGSEKKSRPYGGAGSGGGFAVYTRGWGPREARGRRSHRSSRSNRASESDGSTDNAPNADRKERRRAPRSPRGPKKDETSRPSGSEQPPANPDGLEHREPFAPRGQPSRRGRGGFQGTSRPPAPAKRVTGYGPPNTKSPFSQANRAVKDDEFKDGVTADPKSINKQRPGSTSARGDGKGRDRRPKGHSGAPSGEDENWETTSEHSEGGNGQRRPIGGRSQRGLGGRSQNAMGRQNIRNVPGPKKDSTASDVADSMSELKLTAKKDEEVADDGFQEVRKKNSKDSRGPTKEDNNQGPKQPRSHSSQGGGRNGSTSRNPNDKSNPRGSAPVSNKPGSQYDRPRQPNLPPRFVKQRQKQQMGLVSAFGPDTGAAPPPPAVNAWDKPIAQTLRGNVDEPPAEPAEAKPAPAASAAPNDTPNEVKAIVAPCNLTDKTGVLDGTTPPVETIIFENTNYKTAPPAEALKQKYQPSVNTAKPHGEDMPVEVDPRNLAFNGDMRPSPRSIQEIIAENRAGADGESLGLQMSFEATQKAEDSSDMKLDFAFDSDLGQLTEDKSSKSLGLPRGVHMSTSNTISPLAADLNLKIASVKKVWEMPAVAEGGGGGEELQFAGFEEAHADAGAPPNVCKVKPTQQLQSPPPQHYNHMGYQGYGGLSVPSPPAMLFNSSQPLLGSSQQLPQQQGLYGAFLDQSRGQFGGFPPAPYNYQPPPDMFQSLPSQYRMAAAAAAAGGGAAFGQSAQLPANPSTVLISSTSNSLMSASVKPSSQQIGAIGSKGGGVGGVGGVGAVGGVGSVNTYGQQYLGYSGPVGEAGYSLQGLLPRGAPPQNSYYSPYQPAAAPAPSYPMQYSQQAQSGAFGSQFLSSQLQVAAAVQQMQAQQQQQQQQQQYRAPLQQQYAPRHPPQQPQQLKSPLHEHANGFAALCDAASPTPKGKPAGGHSPPHKYQHPPPPHHVQHHQHQQHQHPAMQQHQQHQHSQQSFHQMVGLAGNRNNAAPMPRPNMPAPRYPSPIQRPMAPAPNMYRAPPPQPPRHQRPNYYQHQQRNGGNGGSSTPGAGEGPEGAGAAPEAVEPEAPAAEPVAVDAKAE